MYQTADWKKEKHIPVIEAPVSTVKGQKISITVSVGKEIAHPNTTEHHISWVEVYFQADGEKFPYQLARVEFGAHGASAAGPNTSTIFTEPSVTVNFKTEKPGIIYAASYCNVHGLWENSQGLKVS